LKNKENCLGGESGRERHYHWELEKGRRGDLGGRAIGGGPIGEAGGGMGLWRKTKIERGRRIESRKSWKKSSQRGGEQQAGGEAFKPEDTRKKKARQEELGKLDKVAHKL